ncbi:MAG: hypothetical protein PHT07_24295 [Paludibacter sp.]|nr:hypothetical protein [Paludibacter sp.]
MKNFRFNQPIKEKNIDNEKTDSVSHPSSSIFACIYENGILKVANQMHVIDDLISNGGKYFIGGDLRRFKDMMFRAPIFIQSEVVNGKRVFETMEKGNGGHKKIKESNKP